MESHNRKKVEYSGEITSKDEIKLQTKNNQNKGSETTIIYKKL